MLDIVMTCDVQTSAQTGGLRGRMRLEPLLTRGSRGQVSAGQAVQCDDVASINTDGDC